MRPGTYSALSASLCVLFAGACNALWGIGDLAYDGEGTVNAGGGMGAGGGGASTTTAIGGAGGAGGSVSTWWSDSWTRRIRVGLDNSARNEGLDDFPLPVVLSATQVASLDAAADGADLRFVDERGELLAHEIELWSAASGGCVWVLVPRIEGASADGIIWLYAGNPAAKATEDAEAVWAGGYQAVWHLNEDAVDESAATLHADSTGNGNTGMQHGNERQAPIVGTLGGAQRFDGVDDYIEVATADLQLTGTELSVEARALLENEVNDYPHVFGAGSDGRYWQQFWAATTVNDPPGWVGGLRAGGVRGVVGPSGGSLGAWTTLVTVYDGGAVRLYVDGQLATAVQLTGALDALTSPLRLGDNPGLSPRQFEGVIDEVRISDVARTPNWMAAQHDAQSGAMVTFGPVEQR